MMTQTADHCSKTVTKSYGWPDQDRVCWSKSGLMIRPKFQTTTLWTQYYCELHHFPRRLE